MYIYIYVSRSVGNREKWNASVKLQNRLCCRTKCMRGRRICARKMHNQIAHSSVYHLLYTYNFVYSIFSTYPSIYLYIYVDDVYTTAIFI